MNELLWIGFALMDLTMVLVVFKLFGRVGLFALIGFNLVVCNLQVIKLVELFGMTTTLGNILYASVFLSTDLLSEFYGKAQARRGVMLGFLLVVMLTVYMQLTLSFKPAPDDFAQPYLVGVFSFLPRIALASLAAYLVSQLHDVWAFHFWYTKTGGKYLWLRNNASTLVSQLLDSGIFCFIAFWGMFEPVAWLEIFWTTYFIKLIVAVMDTPFIYLAKRWIPAAEARA